MPGIVKIIEIRFLESDVWEGDFPRDDTRETLVECDDVEEAVGLLRREGLDFASTGGSWAADPDGSRIIDYGTGMRLEASGHLSGWSEADERSIIETVG